MRTTTIDPLAEKFYDISPYAWCGNNPVRMVDPNGMEVKNGHKNDWEEAKSRKEGAEKAHSDNMKEKNIKSTEGMSRKERKAAGVQDTYKALSKANKDFKSINADYQNTEKIISELKTTDEAMFNQMNTLTYKTADGTSMTLDIIITTGSLPHGVIGGISTWEMTGNNIKGNNGYITLTYSSSGVHLAQEFGHMYSLSLDPRGYTDMVKDAGSNYDCQSNRGNPISINSLGFQDRYNTLLRIKSKK